MFVIRSQNPDSVNLNLYVPQSPRGQKHLPMLRAMFAMNADLCR